MLISLLGFSRWSLSWNQMNKLTATGHDKSSTIVSLSRLGSLSTSKSETFPGTIWYHNFLKTYKILFYRYLELSPESLALGKSITKCLKACLTNTNNSLWAWILEIKPVLFKRWLNTLVICYGCIYKLCQRCSDLRRNSLWIWSSAWLRPKASIWD